MTDTDTQIVEAIKTANSELEASRAIVRDLANELADVIDVIEPTIEAHAKRIRNVRMTSLDEIRQITSGFREMRELLNSKDTERMFSQAERWLAICRELEEFRAVGFLDKFVELFCKETEPAEYR